MIESRIKELEQRPFAKIFPEAIDAIKAGVCPICSNEITRFRDVLSYKEYTVSGMCQACQDKAFGD